MKIIKQAVKSAANTFLDISYTSAQSSGNRAFKDGVLEAYGSAGMPVLTDLFLFAFLLIVVFLIILAARRIIANRQPSLP